MPYFRPLLLLAAMIFVPMAQAQESAACPLLIERALQVVGNACADLERNSACYGFQRVDAAFHQEDPAMEFSRPADRAELINLRTLQTSPLNLNANEWGIALMNVQANVPESLPGQAVIFMLLGDVSVENAVAPDEAFASPALMLELRVRQNANLRVQPGTNNRAITVVPAGTVLQGDARNADGSWVRVIYQGQVGWIASQLFENSLLLNDLPRLSGDEYTPMQAFYFSTGIGQPGCRQAPDSLLIQGPNSMEVTFNANGADIVVGSTILLRQPEASRLEFITVHGYALVGNARVPRGYRIEASVDEQSQVVTGSWSGLRMLTDEELAELEFLRQIDPALLHYAIVPPTRAELQTQPFSGEQSPGTAPASSSRSSSDDDDDDDDDD